MAEFKPYNPYKPPGPPRERVWEFAAALSLVSLAASIALGVVSSVSFFQDSDVMAIPLQSAAQSFVLFACILSTFYLLAHTAAALRGARIYEDDRHGVRYRPPQTISDKWQPFVHVLHAWARLLGLLAFLGWIGAMVFVATLFVHRTNATLVADNDGGEVDGGGEGVDDDEKALYYMRFDMAACALGVVGTLALSMMLWCVKRPYGVRFYKGLEDKRKGCCDVKRVSVVSVGSERSSSTTDAGSVMSGETAVAPASAGAAAGGGEAGPGGEEGGEKEQKLKVDGEQKGEPPKMPTWPGHYPQGQPQMRPGSGPPGSGPPQMPPGARGPPLDYSDDEYSYSEEERRDNGGRRHDGHYYSERDQRRYRD